MTDLVDYTSDAGSAETVIAQEIIRFSVGGSPNIRQASLSLDWTNSDNSIVATVNGVAMAAVLFDTDHSTTLTLVIARLLQNIAITAVNVPDSAEHLLEITGKDGIELIIDGIVTTGTDVPVATITELQAEVSLTLIHLRSRETLLSTDSVATLKALLP